MNIGYKILAGLLLMAALVGAYKGWEYRIDHGGYVRGVAEQKAKDEAFEKAIAADMQKKHDKDVAAVKVETDALRLKFQTVMTEKVAVEKKYADLQERHQAAARAGTERLQCPTAGRAVSPVAEGGNPATASGPGAETRADLLPEASATVLGIAADDARLVRDYGRLVDLYNEARATCNAAVGQ